jgi:hypothetical protein
MRDERREKREERREKREERREKREERKEKEKEKKTSTNSKESERTGFSSFREEFTSKLLLFVTNKRAEACRVVKNAILRARFSVFSAEFSTLSPSASNEMRERDSDHRFSLGAVVSHSLVLLLSFCSEEASGAFEMGDVWLLFCMKLTSDAPELACVVSISDEGGQSGVVTFGGCLGGFMLRVVAVVVLMIEEVREEVAAGAVVAAEVKIVKDG